MSYWMGHIQSAAGYRVHTTFDVVRTGRGSTKSHGEVSG